MQVVAVLSVFSLLPIISSHGRYVPIFLVNENCVSMLSSVVEHKPKSGNIINSHFLVKNDLFIESCAIRLEPIRHNSLLLEWKCWVKSPEERYSLDPQGSLLESIVGVPA